jgi:hypothetical protein
MDIGVQDCTGSMAKKPKRGYSPPKFREDEVNRLVELYKENLPEEFPNLRERLSPGYPVKPLANLPPS